MTDTASAAPSEREQFERYVKAYTGRDIEYHQRNGTTGLEFGWTCWQAARTQPTPPAVVEPLEPVVSNVDGINERIQFRRGWRAAEAAHGIGIKKENGNG